MHRHGLHQRAGASERWLPLAGLAALALGTGLFAMGLGRLVPPCPFHEVLGLHCPGCGSGRALSALLRLDFAAAARSNILALGVLPFVLFGLVMDAARSWGLAPQPASMGYRWLPHVMLIVIVWFWVFRNIPVWPFVLLAPH